MAPDPVRPPRRPNRRGFTLIEALISLLIMLVVLGGTVAIFVQNQRVSSAHVSLAMLRANLRAAAEVIARDLRPVGGFLRETGVNVQNDSLNLPVLECNNTAEAGYQGLTALRHFTGYSAALPDRLRLFELDLGATHVYHSVSGLGQSQMSVQKLPFSLPFEVGDLVIISDVNVGGGRTDLIQLTNITTTGNISFDHLFYQGGSHSAINPSNGLRHSYPTGSLLARARIWEYYVDTTSDPAVPRLFRRNVAANTVDVVAEHIEDLQFAFGLDTTGDNQIDQWLNTGFDTQLTPAVVEQVRAVRMTLIGRTGAMPVEMAGHQDSEQDIYYTLPETEDRPARAGIGTTAGRPYFRERYTQTVFLRNMRADVNP